MGKTRTEITSDINNMKQYLKDIYLLEKEIYCSERAKQKLIDTANGLGIARDIKMPYFLFGFDDLLSLCGIPACFVGPLCFFIACIQGSFKPIIIGIIICAIIGSIICLCQYSSEKKAYNSQMRTYKREKEEDERRIEKESECARAYRDNALLYYQNISACENTLKQLYDLDIIFPKYRNFIAISQIYEYYMSGRCTELEGHEGAYNIYESEVRQNVIIIQLNAVLANLEEIKRTQYMIYDAICEANSRLAHIESNTEAIAYNTAVIAENSEICARYYK